MWVSSSAFRTPTLRSVAIRSALQKPANNSRQQVTECMRVDSVQLQRPLLQPSPSAPPIISTDGSLSPDTATTSRTTTASAAGRGSSLRTSTPQNSQFCCGCQDGSLPRFDFLRCPSPPPGGEERTSCKTPRLRSRYFPVVGRWRWYLSGTEQTRSPDGCLPPPHPPTGQDQFTPLETNSHVLTH